MCGIAGIFSKSPVAPNLIGMMTDAIRHRGPDDEGFLSVDLHSGIVSPLVGPDSQSEGVPLEASQVKANLFLGHRRLSIIDTTPAGHQPMADARGNLWIVFNGEIYNYIELKEELKDHYKFTTTTDTEVILAAYQVWGEACVDHFNGMWSFVIYDQNRNCLFGSRDRFGVKPFYYTLSDGYFAFASEIKAILPLPFVTKRLNAEAAFDYLFMGLEEQEEESLFKGVFELKPARCFRFDLKRAELHQWQYFELEFTDRWEKFDEHIAAGHVERIRELLFDAVRLRLRSDVPIGSCLSGGVDSSSIVCIINNMLEQQSLAQIGNQQKVFTASYPESKVDESPWASLVVQRTNADWRQCYPAAGELLFDLEDLVFSQDIPFCSTSIYAQYQVMKLVAESGVKVVLDGQGADELFTGYTPFYRAFYSEMLRHGDIRRLIDEWQNLVNAPLGRTALGVSLMRLGLIKALPLSIKRWLVKVHSKENNYISGTLWNDHKSRLDKVDQGVWASLNGMLHGFTTGVNLKSLLKYEDRNSMRFSVESRTPFADDYPLVSYLFQVPSSYKIRKGWSKYLLRESMRGVIPCETRTRCDKVGFATPEYSWLNEMGEDVLDYLTDDLTPILNVKELKDQWPVLMKQQSRTGVTNIWRFINLAVWKKVYEVSI